MKAGRKPTLRRRLIAGWQRMSVNDRNRDEGHGRLRRRHQIRCDLTQRTLIRSRDEVEVKSMFQLVEHEEGLERKEQRDEKHTHARTP